MFPGEAKINHEPPVPGKSSLPPRLSSSRFFLRQFKLVEFNSIFSMDSCSCSAEDPNAIFKTTDLPVENGEEELRKEKTNNKRSKRSFYVFLVFLFPVSSHPIRRCLEGRGTFIKPAERQLGRRGLQKTWGWNWLKTIEPQWTIININKPWNKLTSTEFTSTCSKWRTSRSTWTIHDNTHQVPRPGVNLGGKNRPSVSLCIVKIHLHFKSLRPISSNECTLREWYDSLGHSKNPYNVDVMSVDWCVCHVANCIHLSSVNGKKRKYWYREVSPTPHRPSSPDQLCCCLIIQRPGNMEMWFSWIFSKNEKSSKSSYRFQSPFQFFLLQNPSESQQPISARLEILSKYGWTCATKTQMRGCARGLAGSSYTILIHFGIGHKTVSLCSNSLHMLQIFW